MYDKRTIFFIEGLPGTGKSTISKWLHEKTDIPYITEGDLNYPNDLSNISGLPIEVYDELCCEFPFISEFTKRYGSYAYLNIESVKSRFPNQTGLLRLLSQWDIGDEFNPHMALSHYVPCSLEFLKSRFSQLEQRYDSIILDSVWLQNPINELLSRNVDHETIMKYCTALTEMLSKFVLTCIYLTRDNTEETIQFACSAKGEGWTTRVIQLFSSTPYGILHQLEGYSGLLEYFSERAKIENAILSQDIIENNMYTVKEHNWDHVKELIWQDTTERRKS